MNDSDFLLTKMESTKRRAEFSTAPAELPISIWERIAYERAVRRGLAELQASNPEFLLFETQGLYNVRD